MSLAMKTSKLALALSFSACLFGCESEPKKEAAAEKPSAAASAPTPTPTPTPPPPPKPREDCPECSSGIGTSAEPCKGSVESRMMEVTYTGKITDEAPKFKVKN